MVLSYMLDSTTLSSIDKKHLIMFLVLTFIIQIYVSYSNCILEATVVLRMSSQFDKKIDINPPM